MSVEQKKYWQAGRDYELNRILKILQPFAEHSELCESGCYPEDCDAASFQYAIELIKRAEVSDNDVCENCLTPATYTLEGEIGRLCLCSMLALKDAEQKSEWPDEGEDWNIEPYDHPPQQFRDRSNGE